MSIEENKTLVRRVYEELNKRNLDAVSELLATNYVNHQAGNMDIHGP